MSILMVGGSGHLGKNITLQLAKRNLDVTAMLRGGQSHPSSNELREARVRIVDGDLCDPATLTEAVRGVDLVISSATSMPAAFNDGLRKVDHEGTLALIAAAENQGVSRFLYVSYSGNIRHESPLETAKRSCEDRLLSGNMQAVILRPSYFMDMWLSPLLGFAAANGSARIYGTGESRVSYIATSNVADFAVALACEAPTEKNTILELGGPQNLSQLEAVAIFEQALSKQIKVEHVPVEALAAQHASADPLQKTFGALMLGYAEGDVVAGATENARRYGIRLSSVSEYASRLASEMTTA
ncbi:MAG TPA: NAD(P)H-binding protein [Terracidiphilus sp.]|nr:NAD(P)H-binding protein [Terracidiphilus sp.]